MVDLTPIPLNLDHAPYTIPIFYRTIVFDAGP